MKGRMGEFRLYCKTIDFGRCKLSKMESTFYRRFSNEMFSLCRSLPESVQTDSILFLMKYAGLKLGDKLDFFANYYPPAWSIIYWLSHSHSLPTERLKEEDVTNAVTAQSMAMLLHSLDDHLSDGQIPVSPLTLLLRSQVSSIMHLACCNLTEGEPAVERTVRNFIDDYYSSIQDSKGAKCLDSYCDLFRKQMAIWMIAPILLSMKMTGISDFTRDIEVAYGSFGIAWRLLDDIRDIADDMEEGAHSAIYLCLPEEVRTHWNNSNIRSRAEANASKNVILNHIVEQRLIEKIKERICAELGTAASIVAAYRMKGLAREFRCLAHPLKNDGNNRGKDNGRSRISLASK